MSRHLAVASDNKIACSMTTGVQVRLVQYLPSSHRRSFPRFIQYITLSTVHGWSPCLFFCVDKDLRTSSFTLAITPTDTLPTRTEHVCVGFA